MVRIAFFDFCCIFSNSPNRSNPRAMQAEPSRGPEDALLIEEAHAAGSWCSCRCIAGRFLMLYQWDQCQALCCCLLGEEQWFRRFQKLEQIVSSAMLSSPATLRSVFLCLLFGPSSSAIACYATVPTQFYSLTLRFVNDRGNTLVFKWGIHSVSGKYHLSANWSAVGGLYWICTLISHVFTFRNHLKLTDLHKIST